MKKQVFKQVFAVMSLGIFTFTAKAQFGGGTGIEADPYIITTPAQLNDMRTSLSSYYKLGNDIDLSGYLTGEGWEPVGIAGTPFSGGLDGAGHFITGFWINRPTTDNVGLFGVVLGTKIKNLGIVIPDGKEVKGKNNVGAMIGGTDYSSVKILYNECFVSGNITATGDIAGGFHGYSSNNGGVEIVDCYTAGTITAANKAGGLIGQGYRRIKISSSYSTATVIAAGFTVGGLAGEFGFPNGSEIRHDIEYSVAINPSLTAPTQPDNIGRLVGFLKANVGNGSGNYVFDTNYAFDQMTLNGTVVTDGTLNNKNGLNKTVNNLKEVQTFFSENDLYWWDEVWSMGNENYSLPVLKNLSKAYQPKVNPGFLNGSSSIKSTKTEKLEIRIIGNDMYIPEKELNALVVLFDCNGRILMKTTDSQFNISSLYKGVYFVKTEGKVAKVIIN